MVEAEFEEAPPMLKIVEKRDDKETIKSFCSQMRSRSGQGALEGRTTDADRSSE